MDFHPEYLAKEAERLSRDDVLNYAVAQIRAEAYESLGDCDPQDMTRIIQFQQTVKLCNEFMLTLERFITGWGAGGQDETRPV